jgi:DNA-binding LacI/PurR family transcriptional regulator
MINIREIATHMGVCPMTVSNALNNRKGVGKEKADQIRAYAKKMGWSGSHMAAALSSGKTKTIGLLLRIGVYNAWYSEIFDGLCRGFYERGYHVLPVIADRDYEEQAKALQWLSRFKVEALVIGPLGFIQDYQALEIPLRNFKNILAFDTVEASPCDHIGVDAYKGARILVEHLMAQGHRRIGYIGAVAYDLQHLWIRTRYAGFIDAMRELQGEFRPEWALRIHPNADPFQQEDLHFDEAFTTVMTAANHPTAWICHADEYALRGIFQTSQLGLRVPEDVSFAGFDNSPFSRFTHPPLTTIGFNMQAYIKTIINHCLERIEHPATPGDLFRQMLEPVLHQRASVARIN